jgi:hypothetical protein
MFEIIREQRAESGEEVVVLEAGGVSVLVFG